jgi:sulfur carrier protein
MITLNGKPKTLPEKTTLAEFIKKLGYENQRIAVEINEEIIPKSQHNEYIIQINDRIEIISAIGGG